MTIAASAALFVPAAEGRSDCGGLLQPPCPEATPTPSPTPAPTSTPTAPPSPDPKPTRLAPRQFKAIEQLLEAAVANGKPRPTPRAAALYSRRCAAFDRRDLVLASYRRLCRPIARAYVHINRGCDSPRACRRQLAFEARISGAIVRAADEANEGFVRALGPGACRRELALSQAEIRATRVLRSVLLRAAKLYGRVSRERYERLFEKRAEQLRPLRTPDQELRGLRRNCR